MGELIVNGMKMAFVIGVSITFFTAIVNLLNLVVMIAFNNVIGEVFHIISCCLPFDSNAVFGAIALAINGIFAFMIASKIFNLTTNKITV